MLGSSAGDGGAPDECEIVVRGKDAGSIRIGQRYGCDRGRRPRAARSCSVGDSLFPVELRKQGVLVAGLRVRLRTQYRAAERGQTAECFVWRRVPRPDGTRRRTDSASNGLGGHWRRGAAALVV